ncbi:MAG: TIGR04283 family arsenosugar biosynthesis glycosyltransferase [Gammaproteobacteria bacterium]|nr:TIGR04283 family arsenosugar biosynthesis glycosyltransferase [Gammaproteobacteria bacterium]
MPLSLIIPTCNEGRSIRATLLALQSLRANGNELILVDGGSEDDTQAIARPLVDRLLVTAPGRGGQMAAGAEVARQPILWFLHADTLAPVQADRLIESALADAGWGRFDVRLTGAHPLFRLIERLINLRSCLSGIATGDQGIFLRVELYQAIGGMPDQPLMEDVELSRRLKRHGRPVCLKPPLVTSSRRWEQHGILRTVVLMWWLRAAYALGVPAERLARWYR